MPSLRTVAVAALFVVALFAARTLVTLILVLIENVTEHRGRQPLASRPDQIITWFGFSVKRSQPQVGELDVLQAEAWELLLAGLAERDGHRMLCIFTLVSAVAHQLVLQRLGDVDVGFPALTVGNEVRWRNQSHHLLLIS